MTQKEAVALRAVLDAGIKSAGIQIFDQALGHDIQSAIVKLNNMAQEPEENGEADVEH